jgi:nucleoside phosphorylase/CheY-like chemotaxis protein
VIRVLVVDDDPAKRAAMRECLSRWRGSVGLQIVEADAIIPAKLALTTTTFDVLFLDIALPLRTGDPTVRRKGGVELLAEVSETSLYRTPTHIAAVTAFPDIFEAIREQFAGMSIGVIKYDAASEDWMIRVGEILDHADAAQIALARAAEEPSYDVVVLTALAEPELSAVKNLEWSWRRVTFAGDPTIYHEGSATRSNGNMSVLAAACPRVGMPAAAALAAKVAALFRPKYLGLVGICAGAVGRTKLGDVVVADPTWDCGSGKWIRESDDRRFLQAPHQLGMEPATREVARQMVTEQEFLNDAYENWTEPRPANVPRLLQGPMASAAAVLADGASMAEVVKQHREVLAVEMEAYGIFAAAESSLEPRPLVFVFKSVVDFADGAKSDEFQEYGAYCSAICLQRFVERYI